MTEFSTLIFDLDGTLIDSAPDIHAAANSALTQMGRATLDLPTVISFIGNGIGVLTEHCLNATGGGDRAAYERLLALILQAYGQDMSKRTKPYDGVVATLEAFQARGIAMGICTNKPHQPAQDICNALDLTRFFTVIAGAQDGKPRKPDATPLLECIAQMDAAPETTLYIGDSKVDHDTAANAGVAFRLFNGGYLNDPLPNLAGSDRFDSWHSHGIKAG